MSLTSLQVSMDSTDWLQQSTINEAYAGMDSSSSSPISGEMLMTCSRPLVIERRVLVRPQHDDQALKCPRCDSTHTKFCYYNNYSLTQPRYFCKTCRRYWTKGGTLRNIPVGGGCRKTKKVAKKSNHDPPPHHHPSSLPQHHPPSSPHLPSPGTDHLLHLPFPHHDPQHLNSILLGAQGSTLASGGFMDGTGVLESHHRPMDLIMESRLEAIVGSCYRSYDFMGNGGELGFVNGLGDLSNDHGLGAPNFHGISSLHGNSGTFIETCQRLTLNCENDDQNNEVDVKPNTKLLPLDYWQDHGKDSFGYISNNLESSWSAMINGCGPSTH